MLTVLFCLCSVHAVGYSVMGMPAFLHRIMSSVSKKKSVASMFRAMMVALGERTLQPHWWSVMPVLKSSLTVVLYSLLVRVLLRFRFVGCRLAMTSPLVCLAICIMGVRM